MELFGEVLFLINASDSDAEEASFGSQEVLCFLSGNPSLLGYKPVLTDSCLIANTPGTP